MSNLSFLSPAPVTPEMVASVLDGWKSPATETPIFNIENKIEKQASGSVQRQLVRALMTTLVCTPGFLDMVNAMPPFTTPADLEFGPDLCGQEVFDKYLRDVGIAFRFKNHVNFIDEGSKASQFLQDFMSATAKAGSENVVLASLQELLSVIDRASCWPCMPLPEKAVQILVDNPLRKLFGSRRMDCLDRFWHVHVPREGVPLQMIALDACPLLDAPKAVAFVADANAKMVFGELPDTVALPLGVTKQAFLETCERCHAWTRGQVPEEKRERVIKSYKDAIQLVTYKLNSFIAVNGTSVIAGVSQCKETMNGKKTAKEELEKCEVVAAIYYIIE